METKKEKRRKKASIWEYANKTQIGNKDRDSSSGCYYVV